MIKITDNFTDIELNDANEGRRQFWTKVMEALQSRDFAVLKFGVAMPTGAGGFYTELLAVDSINLPEGPTLIDNKVTFPDENSFAIFVHESCHFLHLSVDEGRRMTKGHEGEVITMEDQLDDRTGKLRREIEFEAGYRSVYYSQVYKMFPGSRLVIDLNLANMLNYDMHSQPKEIREKLQKMGKENEKIMDTYKPVIEKVKKFSEWTEPDHVIKI